MQTTPPIHAFVPQTADALPVKLQLLDAAMTVRRNVRDGIAPGFLDDMADTMAGPRRLARDGTHNLPTHDDEVFTLHPDEVS